MARRLAVPLLLLLSLPASAQQDLYPEHAVAQCGGPMPAHPGEVSALALSASGAVLASAGADGSLAISSLRTGRAVRPDGHCGRIGGVAFSPDGRLLASGGFDCRVNLWNAGTGHLEGSLADTSSWIVDVDFDPSGNLLAAGTADGDVLVYDLPTRALKRTIEADRGTTSRVRFSPDGATIASCGDRLVWWCGLGPSSPRASILEDSLVAVIAFSSDGRAILSATRGGRLTLWDRERRVPRWRAWRHQGEEYDAAFTSDGARVVSVGADGWRETSAIDGLPLREGTTAPPARDGCLSRDAAVVASAEAGGVLAVESLGPEARRGRTEGHDGAVAVAVFSPNDETLASGGEDGRLILWEARTGRARVRLQAMRSPIRAIAWSPPGPGRPWLAVGGEDYGIQVRDAESGDRLALCRGLGEPAASVEFTRNGRVLLAVGRFGYQRAWELGGADPQWQETPDPFRQRVPSVPWHEATCHLQPRDPSEMGIEATGSGNGDVSLWEPITGLGLTLRGRDQTPVCGLWMSADQRLLLAAAADGTLSWIETRCGRTLAAIKAPGAALGCIAASKDGSRVATGHADGTLWVWRAPEEVHAPPPDPDPALDLDQAWADLGEETDRAWMAVGRLSSAPDVALPYVELRLGARPDAWFEQRALELDHDDVQTREAATEELRARRSMCLGSLARLSAEALSPEVRERVAAILADLRPAEREVEARRRRRVLLALEWMGTPGAAGLLETMGRGPEGELAPAARSAVRRLRDRGVHSGRPVPEQAW